jgi:hypothetical protein
MTGYSRQYVSQLEQPSKGIPARPLVAAVDAALGARGELIALRDQAAAARSRPLGSRRDPELESRRRVHDLLHNRRCDTDLDHLDRTVGELIELADGLSPQEVSARVQDQQDFVDALLRTPMLPHQQFRLYMIAGHLAGLLAIALLDLGELAGANTCCLEAAVFTELTGHEGLRAWTLAVGRLVDEATRHAERATGRRRPGAETTGPGPAEHPEPQGYATAAGVPDTCDDPIVRRVDELTAGRRAGGERPPLDAEPVSPPWRGVADLMTAPGGRASTPRLVALVKGRIAQFATTSARRGQPLSGISRAFHPPV